MNPLDHHNKAEKMGGGDMARTWEPLAPQSVVFEPAASARLEAF